MCHISVFGLQPSVCEVFRTDLFALWLCAPVSRSQQLWSGSEVDPFYVTFVQHGRLSLTGEKSILISLIIRFSGRANFFRGQGATGLSGHLRRVISLQEGRRF